MRSKPKKQRFSIIMFLFNLFSLATSFAGGNMYFLWACNTEIQKNYLTRMSDANMSVIRTFVTGYNKPWEMDHCDFYDDIESNGVGVWNNTILDRIDDLVILANSYHIKVTLTFHSRQSFYDPYESYVHEFNIPNVEYGTYQPLNNFYANSSAHHKFKARQKHILNYASKTGLRWKDMNDYFFSFESQNEEQFKNSDKIQFDWLCDMATHIKKFTNIQVTSGGGWSGLIIPYNYATCDSIDILAIHDYSSPRVLKLRILQHFIIFLIHRKKWIVQEFPVTDEIEQWITAASYLDTPWIYWGAGIRPEECNYWDIIENNSLLTPARHDIQHWEGLRI